MMMPLREGHAPEPPCNAWPVAIFVVRAWATSVEVFLHRGFGERYLGFQAAAILLLIPLYCLGWKGHDLRPMFDFLLVYFLMCGVHRVDGLVRRFRGKHCHSYYSGWPHVMRLLRRSDELRVKRLVEPLMVVAIGLIVREENRPLGAYLIGASVCLFISVCLSEAEARARALDLNDAVIDQQQVAERFRAMRGEQ